MIHESGEDYLETIYILNLARSGVHAIDVANELNFSKPSVTRALKILKANGYIVIDEDNHITFTEGGLIKAKDVYERHMNITEFLKICGVSDENASKDACKLEHDISVETYECIKNIVYNGSEELNIPNLDEFGNAFLISKLAKKIGLENCLINTFDDDTAHSIIAIVAYMISNDCIMDDIEDWTKKIRFGEFTNKLTEESVSKMFDEITDDQINQFFAEWIKTVSTTGDCILYNIKPLLMNFVHIIENQINYFDEDEDFKETMQNYCVFSDAKTRLPLYYDQYNGNLDYDNNFRRIVEKANGSGIRKINLVLDEESFDESNFEFYSNVDRPITFKIPATWSEAQNIREQYGDAVVKAKYKVPNYNVNCITINKQISNLKGRLFLYFDLAKKATATHSRFDLIEEMKVELEGMESYSETELGIYSNYFIITKNEDDSGFSYKVNYDAIDDLIKDDGYYYIFTNDMSATPEEIIGYYDFKEIISDLFEQINYDIDETDLLAPNKETGIKGKLFVIFIATILKTELTNRQLCP
ncbi:MAG: hypothetical protein LBF68_01465 [Christensenellaceae bacterium]|jgi:Mn-dependent DtxR family transcriptional regulator|nr:hypothetical protein [Christensenellaceae bacterium]